MRTTCALGLLVLIAGACRSTATDAPVAPAREDVRPQSRAGVCAPSSVPHVGACPKRNVPPGTGSSPEGCKSDADCKSGVEGRCIGQHVTRLEVEPRRADNLLAAPPPPPLRSNCVYDRCVEDKDCGANGRCDCRPGLGTDRNTCKQLDACLSDNDCSADTLCLCGTAGVANNCAAGNCRTDADCNGLACEPDDNGARYCRSPRDACHKATDCKADAASYGSPICVYKPTTRARACDVLMPPLPG